MKVFGSPKTKTEEASPYAGHSKGGDLHVAGAEPAQETFLDVVEDIEARQLIEELDKIGTQLSRFPTGALLARYRGLVAMALDKVRKSMKIRREFKWRRTERSMFVTLERTEEALEEMDEALLKVGDRTRLLSLMEEIKGCLISLLF